MARQAASLAEEYIEDIKEFGTTIKTDTEKALESVSQEFGTNTSSTARSSDNSSSAQPAFKIDINVKDEEAFREFMKNFDLSLKKSEIASLLASNTAVHALYQQLVPTEVSADEFWGRYFWKNEENAKKEQTRLQLLNKTKALATKMSEDEFKWDDDEEDEKEVTQEQPTQATSEVVETTENTIADSDAQLETTAPNTADKVESASEEPQTEEQEPTSVEHEEKKKQQDEEAKTAPEASYEPVPVEKSSNEDEATPIGSEEAKPVEEDVFDWN